VYSLAAVGAGRVAVGRSDGAVQVTSSITDLDEEEHGHEKWTEDRNWVCSGRLSRACVSDEQCVSFRTVAASTWPCPARFCMLLQTVHSEPAKEAVSKCPLPKKQLCLLQVFTPQALPPDANPVDADTDRSRPLRAPDIWCALLHAA